MLQVANGRDAAGRPVARTSVSCGARRLWADEAPGAAAAAAGSLRFAAVALQDGSLQVQPWNLHVTALNASWG